MKMSLAHHLQLAFKFEFQHDGHQIVADASSLTGKEVITVDGKEVSRKRCLGFRSRHQFDIDGKTYTLRFDVSGFLLCRVECELFCGVTQVGSQIKSSFDNKKVFFRNLILFFFVGMAFGYLAATAAIWLMG